MIFDKADLIVARYNENLDWIKSKYDNVFIYNKGVDDIPNSIKLNNIGRESHTYLHHIYYNYEKLNEINIFAQGSIEDHSFLGEKFSEEYLYKMYLDTKKYGASLNRDFFPEHIIPYGGYNNFRLNYYNKYLNKSKYSISEWKKEFNISNKESIYSWYIGAIFSVSKNKILSRTKNFYKNLLEDQELNTLNPEIAHYYERSWALIFNLD
jgi:hypothetical protein